MTRDFGSATFAVTTAASASEPEPLASAPVRIDWASQICRIIRDQHVAGKAGVESVSSQWVVDQDNVVSFPQDAFQRAASEESVKQDWRVAGTWIQSWHRSEDDAEPCLKFAWRVVFRVLECQQKQRGEESWDAQTLHTLPAPSGDTHNQQKRTFAHRRFAAMAVAILFITLPCGFFALTTRGHTPPETPVTTTRGHTPPETSAKTLAANPPEPVTRGHTPPNSSPKVTRGHTPPETSHKTLAANSPEPDTRGHTPSESSREIAATPGAEQGQTPRLEAELEMTATVATASPPNVDIASIPSRQQFAPIAIAAVDHAPKGTPKIELPTGKTVELLPGLSSAEWQVPDPRSSTPVATLRLEEHILLWNWLADAPRNPASELFHTARVVWRSNQSSTYYYLRQPMLHPDWVPQWERGSVSESFDLSRAPAPTSFIKVDYVTPLGIDPVIASSHRPDSRRGNFEVQFRNTNDPSIAVRIAISWNGSHLWQLHQNAWIQLDPRGEWLTANTSQLDAYTDRMERQRLHAQQSVTQLRQAYNLLLEPHRTQSRIQRAQQEIALEQFEKISKRLTNARRLLHLLQHETSWQISLVTPWEPTSTEAAPTHQRILQLGDIERAQKNREDLNQEIPDKPKAKEKN